MIIVQKFIPQKFNDQGKEETNIDEGKAQSKKRRFLQKKTSHGLKRPTVSALNISI